MVKPLPADPHNLNADRARSADAALQVFIPLAKTDDEAALADLLCNLMHWSDRNGIDFDGELRRAQINYAAEITPDDGIAED